MIYKRFHISGRMYVLLLSPDVDYHPVGIRPHIDYMKIDEHANTKFIAKGAHPLIFLSLFPLFMFSRYYLDTRPALAFLHAIGN
jgi:hypothetical protein